ncbi:SAM domain-containing protein [Pseudovibrio sp. Ad13]|uniref:SAM domain-containing protein n=1 Tax=Pseudovibrio sp. Ad13 TaxID=989396 RepID=UPI00128FCF6D|nr:SAM domain-containing protein [Pseudovibrio sp. Ad13]
MIVTSLLAIALLFSLAGIIYPFKPFKRRWRALFSSILCFVLVGVFAPKPDEPETQSGEAKREQSIGPEKNEKYWVVSKRLNRRTCPSVDCGVVGQFFFREAAMVLETKSGWARVTEPYDAFCVDGQSKYVDAGNAFCNSSNGITDGAFSEWVSAEFLSQDRPPDPAADASGVEKLVAGSDDFAQYRTMFTKAAQSLIEQRRCTEQDFQEMGGWVKSSNHRRKPIYFTYCGGGSVANRLYLNATSGEVFR